MIRLMTYGPPLMVIMIVCLVVRNKAVMPQAKGMTLSQAKGMMLPTQQNLQCCYTGSAPVHANAEIQIPCGLAAQRTQLYHWSNRPFSSVTGSISHACPGCHKRGQLTGWSPAPVHSKSAHGCRGQHPENENSPKEGRPVNTQEAGQITVGEAINRGTAPLHHNDFTFILLGNLSMEQVTTPKLSVLSPKWSQVRGGRFAPVYKGAHLRFMAAGLRHK